MAEPAEQIGFLARWSRRKAVTRDGHTVSPASPVDAGALPLPTGIDAAPALPAGTTVPAHPPAGQPAPGASVAPPPTLEDAGRLTPQSDFSRFVAGNVAPEVRHAALQRLFSDPHFNVMDGLDVYIDDFGKPDPLGPGMLRRMAQAEFLNLFADEKKAAPPPGGDAAALGPAAQAAAHEPVAAPAPPEGTPADEDADLRLQPDDAAGPLGAEPGAGAHAGREH